MFAIFCSVCIVGSAWGEASKITPPRISAPDYVDAGKSFQIKITFDKDTYSTGKYSFQIVFPEQFNKGMINFQITNEAYAIIANSPTQEGDFVIQYSIHEQDTTVIWTGSVEINILALNISVKESEKQSLHEEPSPMSVVGGLLMDIISIPIKFIFAWKGT